MNLRGSPARVSSARRRIRPRTSSGIADRPLPGRDRQRQYSRKPARCQPMTVSGFTMTRRSVHRGQRRRSVVQNSRSKEFNGGRGRLRFSTASCWRKASTSSAVSLRVLKKTRTAARREKTNWNTIHSCNMSYGSVGRPLQRPGATC